MDLDRLIRKYKSINLFCISTKQKAYLRSLLIKMALDEGSTEITLSDQGIFIQISEKLDRSISTWEDLTFNDVKILISILERYAPATRGQILTVYMKYREEEVNNLLRREISNRKLTIREVQFLLMKPGEFSYWAKEHSIVSTDRYEYGWQDSDYCADGKMFYLKFYDLLMIDFDEISEDEVRSRLTQVIDYTFI